MQILFKNMHANMQEKTGKYAKIMQIRAVTSGGAQGAVPPSKGAVPPSMVGSLS